jgi:hypothetical protein
MDQNGGRQCTGSMLSFSLLTGRFAAERPGAVKSVPLLGAAKRTLDGEDRSETIPGREKRTNAQRKWPATDRLQQQARVFVGAILLCSNVAFGQRLSYGVVAGTALTDDFTSYYSFEGDFSTVEKSGDKGVIVGPMLEWNFSPYFSVEVNGLFRELRFEDLQAGAHNPTVTWEFPILAKYRLSLGHSPLLPFIEAGPSFRTTGNLNANPSHAGITAGAGFDFKLHQINISPTLRYTRWAEDSHPLRIQSRPDQLELLVGFSHTPGSYAHPFNNRISVGAVLGTNLLGDYDPTSTTVTDLSSGTQTTFASRSGPRSFLVGPAVEVQVRDGLSLEADAVYRPIREHYTNTGTISGQPYIQSGDSSFSSWQFPVLAKYRLPLLLLGDKTRLFVELGPSFRISGPVTHFGLTTGGGVSTRLGPLTIAPAVRYTRWQTDPLGEIKSNEADLLVGLTF